MGRAQDTAAKRSGKANETLLVAERDNCRTQDDKLVRHLGQQIQALYADKMKMDPKMSSDKLVLAIAVAIFATGGAFAAEVPLTFFGTNMPSVDFHGFASQGFMASTSYNYLDNDTAHGGSFRLSEAGLNASMNPFPRTRITAQAFTYDVGDDGDYDVVLDYASIEYTFNDYIGIRAGRIRRPQGIYNDIQDVDVARTFALLPQGVYDARFRDFYLTLDGGELFGDIPLNKAGDLSYEVYGGRVNPSLDGGAANRTRSDLPPFVQLDSIDPFEMAGMQLWWNTPVNGLRFGAAGGYIFDSAFHTTAFGIFHSTTKASIPLFQGSAEYLWKSWTFQAEYGTDIQYPNPGISLRGDAWYASAAYRFNKWFETGAYYGEYYNDVSQREDSLQFQKDAALALRFDPKDWWTLKIEGHYLHGTGLLDDDASNPVQNNNPWFMLVVKTTFSF